MIYKIKQLKIGLLVLTVIGIGSGCNESQNQLGENNNDLSISQVHTSFLFRFLTLTSTNFINTYKHNETPHNIVGGFFAFIFNSLGCIVSKR